MDILLVLRAGVVRQASRMARSGGPASCSFCIGPCEGISIRSMKLGLSGLTGCNISVVLGGYWLGR